MSIVLVGSTSGSCTLQEQAVAGTTVLTLPTTSGTILTTGSSGQSIPKAALPTGSVLQVVSAVTSSSTSTNSTTYVDTTLSASITPTASSSRIFVIAYCPYIATGASGYGEAFGIIGLHRSSTAIEEQQVGYNISGNTSVKSIPQAWSVSVVDSPATTSSVNYNIKIRVPITSFTMQLRYPDVYVSSPQNNNPRITLMEIAS